jgi:hypothetical protein
MLVEERRNIMKLESKKKERRMKIHTNTPWASEAAIMKIEERETVFEGFERFPKDEKVQFAEKEEWR